MKRLLVALALLALSGCASVAKIDSGDRMIGERMSITLSGAWNHVSASSLGPALFWTMEGLPVDLLLIYAGIKDGEAIHAVPPGQTGGKVYTFRANMQPDEIAALFEGMLTRDGSKFKLLKIEPNGFGGQKGFRFEYMLTRKIDNVELSGVAYGTVSKGELFALVYSAPRLAFFARHAPTVEKIASTVRVRE